MNHATYRIGEDKHHPRGRNGLEIDEETKLSRDDFLAETEMLTGAAISLIWFGRVPMPGADDWIDKHPSLAPPTANED